MDAVRIRHEDERRITKSTPHRKISGSR